MYIYILFILTILIFSVIGTRKYKTYSIRFNKEKISNANEFYLILVGLFCVLIPTLRADIVGLDTIVYKDYMIASTKMNFLKIIEETRFEPGYILVQYLSGLFNNVILLQFIVAITYIVGVCKLINKYSPIIWLSFLFFIIYGFYYLSFNEMRQAMAMGLACFSFQYIVKSNVYKFLFWVFVASLFHTTALMLMPTYLFSRITKIKFYYIVICFALFFLISKLVSPLYETLNALSSIQYDDVEEETGGTGLLLLQLITLSLGFFLRKQLSKRKFYITAYMMLCYSIVLFPICSLNPAMFRLEQYSWIYMIILVPALISNLKYSFIQLCAAICYIFLGLVLGLTSYYTEGNQIIPYMFFWEK